MLFDTSSEAPSSANVTANAADTASDASFSANPSVTTVASLVPLKNDAALAQTPVANATTATTEHPAADEGGLPQLRTEFWGGQIVWLLLIFAVFYFLMAKVFTPRIRNVIETRGSTIAEDLANARANRDEAEAQAQEAAAEIAEAHAAARKLASEAVARSNAEIAAKMAAKDEELSARLSTAEASIRAKRDEAMSHVAQIATDTASALVEKLTGKAATAAALKSALPKG